MNTSENESGAYCELARAQA